MVYIPIGEAVKRLGKSDRQVRRMVHSGQLAWRYVPDRKGKRLEILASDVDKLSRHALPTQELERLDRLERELAQLRGQVDTLSQRVEAVERSPRKTSPRTLQPQKQGLESDTLPAGYIPIYDLIKEHNLVRQRNAIMRHMQPYLKKGSWNVGGHEVKNCLDQDGVREFMRLFVTQA